MIVCPYNKKPLVDIFIIFGAEEQEMIFIIPKGSSLRSRRCKCCKLPFSRPVIAVTAAVAT